jgi:putative transposase
MREWHPLANLVGLPGLPSTRRSVLRVAKRDQWRSRPRAGQGGGREYHFDSLPAPAQAYLRGQAEQTALAVAQERALTVPDDDQARRLPVPVEVPSADSLASWQRRARDCRKLLLTLLDELALELGSEKAAALRIEAMSHAGELPSPYAEVVADANARPRGGAATVSRSSLQRWAKDYRDALAATDGQVALAVNILAPETGPGRERPRWLALALERYQDPMRKPSMADVHRDLVREGVPMPPLRTLQQRMKQLPVIEREWGRHGSRARRAILPFTRRSTDGLWPLDVVAVDGHQLKAYVAHPFSGQAFRPEVTTYLDIATRRIVGHAFWVAESQYGIWLAMRVMILGAGIPAIQYSDNGAYTAQEHRLLLDRLGITPVNARAYNPQANGAVERINRALWLPVAGELFPAGRQVDAQAFKDRFPALKATGKGLPSWEHLLQLAGARVAEYNATPHTRLRDGKARLSPDQAWQRAVEEGWQPTQIENDNLYELLPAEARQVRRGEVTVQGRIYYAQALAAHHGETVLVHSDPVDGAKVWISDPTTGRLLTEAKRDGNTRNYIADDKVSHALEKRKQAAAKRKLRLVEEITARETPAIDLSDRPPIDLPDLQIVRPGEYIPREEPAGALEAAAVQLPPARSYIDNLDNDGARFDAWRDIGARLAAGEPVDERERKFHSAFGATDYCRRTAKLWEDWERQTATV